MRNSTVTALQQSKFPSDDQTDPHIPQCLLKWRQGQLLVKLSHQVRHLQLPPLDCNQWLVKCMQNSSVRLVRLDPELGEAKLMLWVNACEQSKKPAYLKIPAARTLTRQHSQGFWWLKLLVEWSCAVVLLLTLSPVMLGLILLVRVYVPGTIFVGQWHVGGRGKIFRLFKFRTTVASVQTLHCFEEDSEGESNITELGRWMRKYKLDELPQLFNVLRGDMKLVGPHPRTLCDTFRISPEKRQQLNALPGIIETWNWKRL